MAFEVSAFTLLEAVPAIHTHRSSRRPEDRHTVAIGVRPAYSPDYGEHLFDPGRTQPERAEDRPTQAAIRCWPGGHSIIPE